MRHMRWLLVLAAIAVAATALGCAATEEKKDDAGGTVTVSGSIIYAGEITATNFLLAVFTQAEWDSEDSDPLILASVPAAASAPYCGNGRCQPGRHRRGLDIRHQ